MARPTHSCLRSTADLPLHRTAWHSLSRGGAKRDRTADLLLAKQALSQLSYGPARSDFDLVGLVGFEPTTLALSRRCSNQLSYRPAREPRLTSDLLSPQTTTKQPQQRTLNFVRRTGLRSQNSRQVVGTAFFGQGLLLCCFVSRKEVIQPHLPIRLPCYDFTPVTKLTVVVALLAVRLTPSGEPRSHGVTGGVYKTRERIHRDMLIRDY